MTTTPVELCSARWGLDITAASSIVHRADQTATGPTTFTRFRRERILAADGATIQIPVVSGNAVRGVLRRIGEELLRPVLRYDGQLGPAAAYLLRNGGALAKTTVSYTPEDERRLKQHIPLIALFGGAAGGRIMKGAVTVDKAIPECLATEHLLQRPPRQPVPPLRTILGRESHSHTNDLTAGATDTGHGPLMRFSVETLLAGTRLQTSIRGDYLTPVEHAFLADIVDHFCRHGHLGGGSAAGHGAITVTAHPSSSAPAIDWRPEIAGQRDVAIELLRALG